MFSWSTTILLLALPLVISAYGGGGGGGYGGGGGGGYGGGGGGGYGKGVKGPVQTAIESHRTVEVKPVQMMNEPHEPQVIEVPSEDTPVTVHFKSQSSRVLVQQTHTPAQHMEPEHTSSEDEPQKVIHEVVKPVIQEIREIIQPYRRLIQQIQPVIEQTHTVIAKGEPRPQVQPLSVPGASGGGRSYGGGSSSKYGDSNYAAAASSSVSIKTPSSSSNQDGESNVREQSDRNSQGPFMSVASPSAGSSASSGSAQRLSLFSPSSRTYSARRGDFHEPQPSKARITLRPAPVSDARPSQAKVSLITPAAYQKPQPHPQPLAYRQNAPVPQPAPIQYYEASPSQYSYMTSALREDDIPFITFVAQPVRYRARAARA